MPWAKCHHCDDWFYTDDVRDVPPPEVLERLSPAAVAILFNVERLPADFRRGLRPVALRPLANLLGYSSHANVREGLIELAELGFARYIAYGQTKHRYTLSQRLSYHHAA